MNTQIREAARTRLAALSALASVSTNRSTHLRAAELPAAVIETSTDEVEQASKGGRERRLVALTVVLVTPGDADDLDDTLDGLRSLVETALADKLGLATNMQHTGAELELMSDEDGDRWFAFYALTWQVEVWTQKGSPEVAL